MQVLSTRRSIMAVAALPIVIFHLWIPVFQGGTPLAKIEHLIISLGYVGVDLFFLLSAYSLTQSDINSAGKFLSKRFLRIYPMFFLFALAALTMGKLTVPKFVSTLTGLEFLRSGGGSFLWFIPALFIMYLVFPYANRLLKPLSSPLKITVCLVSWFLITYACEHLSGGAIDIGIFLCRVPAIFSGVFLSKYEDSWNRKSRFAAGIMLFIAGLFLIYNLGYLYKLTVPFKGMFYVMSLPFTLGILLLSDLSFSSFRHSPEGENSRKFSLSEIIGASTLELYCLQMLMGPILVQAVFKFTSGNKILSNILSLSILIISAHVLSIAYKKFSYFVEKRQVPAKRI